VENKERGFHIFVAGVSPGLISLFSTVFWVETGFTAGIELINKGWLRSGRFAATSYPALPLNTFIAKVSDLSATVANSNDLNLSCFDITRSLRTAAGRIEHPTYRPADHRDLNSAAALTANRRPTTIRFTIYNKPQGRRDLPAITLCC
jgi:hypothetical protein